MGIDLTKTIKINNDFQISYGKIIFVLLFTLFEALGMICANNWIIHPSVFFLFSNAIFTLSKRNLDESLLNILKKEFKQAKSEILRLKRKIRKLEKNNGRKLE